MRPHPQPSPFQDFTSPTTGASPANTERFLDAFSRARQCLNIPFARFMMKCRDRDDRPIGAIGAGLGLGVSVQWTNRRQRLLDFLNYSMRRRTHQQRGTHFPYLWLERRQAKRQGHSPITRWGYTSPGAIAYAERWPDGQSRAGATQER